MFSFTMQLHIHLDNFQKESQEILQLSTPIHLPIAMQMIIHLVQYPVIIPIVVHRHRMIPYYDTYVSVHLKIRGMQKKMTKTKILKIFCLTTIPIYLKNSELKKKTKIEDPHLKVIDLLLLQFTRQKMDQLLFNNQCTTLTVGNSSLITVCTSMLQSFQSLKGLNKQKAL